MMTTSELRSFHAETYQKWLDAAKDRGWWIQPQGNLTGLFRLKIWGHEGASALFVFPFPGAGREEAALQFYGLGDWPYQAALARYVELIANRAPWRGVLTETLDPGRQLWVATGGVHPDKTSPLLTSATMADYGLSAQDNRVEVEPGVFVTNKGSGGRPIGLSERSGDVLGWVLLAAIAAVALIFILR